jgi:hypothetical protein
MHYLSSVYSVNQPLHVLGIFVAHHQEVYCICTTIGTCFDFQLTVCWPANRQMYRDARSTKHKTCNKVLKGNICPIQNGLK